MKAYAKEIVLGLVLLVCTILFVWKMGQKEPEPPPGFEPAKDCGKKLEPMVMQDEWLKGVLEKDAEFTAVTDWNGCHKLVHGDLVLYQISKSHDPVVRVVAGVPGDKFKLKKAKNGNSWNIEINGELFMEGDKPYHFGSANPPALKLYQDARDGLLDQSSVLLFSRVSPGDQDSGSLGVLSAKDIAGVVVTGKLY